MNETSTAVQNKKSEDDNCEPNYESNCAINERLAGFRYEWHDAAGVPAWNECQISGNDRFISQLDFDAVGDSKSSKGNAKNKSGNPESVRYKN